MGMAWTDRLEAVKSYVFDLEGNVAARTESSKRAPGCYTLKDAIKLTRSSDSSLQEAALLLLAAVLLKATEGLEEGTQKASDVDWQAVWACAVGPGLDLASSLRLALDETNSPVITACAKTLHALLSCSANETVFGLQESLWPGNKSAFTAPVVRRRSELEDGFIGGGRWKYHVHASDLYPETQLVNPLSDTEEDKDSTGDEGEALNKDVAAGLLRMDILTRIQYIFEIEQVRAADKHLLGVVIALARHSPAAAKAVMKCPRLMDSVIQRFLLTEEDLNGGLRPAHTKAIQLLKILSQASAANCIRFAETGALQVAQCELYKQGFPLPSDPTLDSPTFKGICATVVECLRLWRVCINHQIGIALFADIYPALGCWLTPLSCKEITSPTSSDSLFLAQESFSLLERLAWTLPISRGAHGSVHVNWAWKVALPLVVTASGWLTKDRIAAVNVELAAESPSKLRVSLLSTFAAVFHFLGTVFEMFAGDAKESKQELRPIAVALAGHNLVKFEENNGGEKSMLELMLSMWGNVDTETAMALISAVHGLVRLLRVTDLLCGGENVEPLSRNPLSGEPFSGNLVSSADGELRKVLVLFGNDVLKKRVSHGEGVSGPAPGLGFGWGQSGGGLWSKPGLLLNGMARLLTELLEVLPLKGNNPPKIHKTSANGELLWRISCSLCVAGMFGPGDSDMVLRIYANVLLHTDVVTLVIQPTNGAHHDYEKVSKILQEHYKKAWLSARPGKSSHAGSRKKLRTSLIATKLSNLSEESAKLAEEKPLAVDGLPNDMVTEWAKQRLPLPSHCWFSPIMAINMSVGHGPECKILDDGTFVISHDEGEFAMECGLAWLLGLELLSQQPHEEEDINSNVFGAIPVVWKLHGLASLYLFGGDVFRRKGVTKSVGKLQRLYGKLLNAKGEKRLDFEGVVDGRYCAFVDALVTKFSRGEGDEDGDAEFGAQVAVYLRRDVGDSVRLRTWRALAATGGLNLLPPLADCLGDPAGYLFPVETNLDMIEAFVSASTSGQLALVDGKTSVASTLALHHLAAFLFEENSTADRAVVRKTAKNLFTTSKQAPQQQQQQAFLRSLVECSLSWPAKSVSSVELERRLGFVQTVCEGDELVINQLRELLGVK